MALDTNPVRLTKCDGTPITIRRQSVASLTKTTLGVTLVIPDNGHPFTVVNDFEEVEAWLMRKGEDRK